MTVSVYIAATLTAARGKPPVSASSSHLGMNGGLWFRTHAMRSSPDDQRADPVDKRGADAGRRLFRPGDWPRLPGPSEEVGARDSRNGLAAGPVLVRELELAKFLAKTAADGSARWNPGKGCRTVPPRGPGPVRQVRGETTLDGRRGPSRHIEDARRRPRQPRSGDRPRSLDRLTGSGRAQLSRPPSPHRRSRARSWTVRGLRRQVVRTDRRVHRPALAAAVPAPCPDST